MADADITDLEIAALCDLLEGPRANLKAHKRSVLDQLLVKGLVKPALQKSPQDSNLLTRLNTFSRNAASDLAVARPMRKIDQNLQLVAGPDQLLAEVGQSRSRVGRRVL